MLKRFSILILVLIAIMALTVSCSRTDKKEAEAKKEVVAEKKAVEPVKTPGSVGTKAADFNLTDLKGKPVSLKDYEGKVILLNFWATWCPPCKAEIPDFIQMYEKYKSRDLVIIGISGFRDNVKQVEKYVETAQINYPVFYAEDKQKSTLIPNYGNFQGIPTTFLIDKKGTIQYVWTGTLDEEEFLKKGEKYLK